MMGDGLHHEAGGKWISAEYRKISKLLYPEEFAKKRKQKAEQINQRIAELLPLRKCTKLINPNVCGADLKQSRSGSKVVLCTKCDGKYKLGKAK